MYNLRNVKNTHGGVLLLVKLPPTLQKVTLLHWCFSRFLDYTDGTKSQKTSHHYHHYFIYYFFELPSLKMFLICFFSQFRCSYQVCSSKKNSVMLLISCLRDTDQTFESIPYISFQIWNICSNSATKVSVYRTLSNI